MPAFRRRPLLNMEVLEDRTLLSSSIPLSSTTWTALGPAPIGNPNVANTGRLAAIATHPTNSDIIYVATAGGGVWKSTNATAATINWTPLTDSQQTLFMGALAIAPSDPTVLYAGTGEATNSGLSFYGRGVLKSTDGGTSWNLLTDGGVFDRRTISQIVVNSSDPNTVYVAISGGGVNGQGGNTGIYRSTDGGTNWTNTTTTISTNANYSDLVIDPSNPNTLYAAAGLGGDAANGIYKTTDAGGNWTKLAGGLPASGLTIGLTKLAIAASDPQTLYAAIAGTSAGGSTAYGSLYKMMRTTDGGTNWSDLTGNLGTFADYLGSQSFGGQGWYDSTLAVDPSNSAVVYAAGIAKILKSSDAGGTWDNINSGGSAPHVDHHAMAFDANGRLLDGNDGGIWRLDNPNVGSISWTNRNGDLNITQFIGIALHPTNADIAYGGTQDNGTLKFTDNLVWSRVSGGDGGFARVDQSSPNTVYHEFFGISLERSDNGGATWAAKTTGIGNDPANFYVPYVMDPADSTRLLLGTNRVYETHNRADNWTPLSTPNANGWVGSATIDALAAAPTDHNTIYASAGGHIFVTFDHGATWQHRDAGRHDSFSELLVDPTGSQHGQDFPQW